MEIKPEAEWAWDPSVVALDVAWSVLDLEQTFKKSFLRSLLRETESRQRKLVPGSLLDFPAVVCIFVHIVWELVRQADTFSKAD